MRIMTRCVAMVVSGVLCGCSSGSPPPHLNKDANPTLPDLLQKLDGDPDPDLFAPMPDMGDGGSPDGGCVPGTPDNCASCGDVCPGQDDQSTTRVCIANKCDIQCKGEFYDVNGLASDGCEAQDDTPVHENQLSAKDLGKVADCKSDQPASGALPSDARKHLVAPTDRPNGREDWFKLHITDKTLCIVEAEIDVSLSILSSSATYSAEAFYVCDGGKKLSTAKKTGKGGSTLSLKPSTSCTTLGDDSGTVYLKISKVSGSHSKNKYSLTILP